MYIFPEISKSSSGGIGDLSDMWNDQGLKGCTPTLRGMWLETKNARGKSERSGARLVCLLPLNFHVPRVTFRVCLRRFV